MLRHLSTGFYRALANPQSAAAMCRGLKQTTGLVGIEVDPNARENLIAHLNQVKNLVSDLIPVDTEYRKLVEQTCDYKLKTIESVPDDKELEEVLGFQLEEEIILCQDEIGLIPKMAEWKPWEVPEGHQVPVYQEEDPMEVGKWSEVMNPGAHHSHHTLSTPPQPRPPT